MPSSIPTSSDDATAVIIDLYDMVAAEVKAVATVCPAAESSPFFNPVIYREVPDGMNARGGYTLSFRAYCWHKIKES